MIAVDSSAIMAILYDEPDAARLQETLAQSDGALISAANMLELQLVVAGVRSRTGWDDVTALLAQYGIAIHPFDEHQLHFARRAALRYGRGRDKAKLNFGDCFAYALARTENIPLLCTGKDFMATDVTIA